MRFLGLIVLVWLALVSADDDVESFNVGQERRPRFATQSCSVVPETNKQTVIERNQGVKIVCNLDSPATSCTWTHFHPFNEGKSSTNSPDVICTSSSGDNGKNCDTDTRITFQTDSPNKCGLTISSIKPEDTGRWRLLAAGLATSQTNLETTTRDFEIYTYNTSIVSMVDNRDMPLKTIDTSYNFNTKLERWETGKSDWETLEFRCNAFYGRPTPKFVWYFENNNNDPIVNADGFTISESLVGTVDRYGYIENFQSKLTFRVDDKLKAKLEKHSINTNPANGVVSFELRCEVLQGMTSAPERPSVRINMKKAYDDGNLTAGTIGLIVGIIVAVLIVVVVVGLIMFAKASQMWCFADEEQGYKNPDRSNPKTAAGAHTAKPSQRPRHN